MPLFCRLFASIFKCSWPFNCLAEIAKIFTLNVLMDLMNNSYCLGWLFSVCQLYNIKIILNTLFSILFSKIMPWRRNTSLSYCFVCHYVFSFGIPSFAQYYSQRCVCIYFVRASLLWFYVFFLLFSIHLICFRNFIF